MNEVFFLLEATIRLYPVLANGLPDVEHAVWIGACEGKMQIHAKWIEVETRPTGAPYPRKHPLIEQYEVTMDRAWVLPLTDLSVPAQAAKDLRDFVPDNGLYVLDVLWESEDSGDWIRRTFYGVTIASRNLDSDQVFEFSDAQVFNAEYFVADQGRGEVASIADALPCVVAYVAVGGILTWLYSFSASTGLFTELMTGLSAGKATIQHNPDLGGSWDVQFAGKSVLPSLSALGVLTTGPLHTSAPKSAALPRLEFHYGSTRVLSFAADGSAYAAGFQTLEAEVPVLPGFNIQAGNHHYLRIDLGGVTATTIAEAAPGDPGA